MLLHVPCLLQACPTRDILCACCIESVLFLACFLIFVVRSVEFVVALKNRCSALRSFVAIDLSAILVHQSVCLPVHHILLF